MLRLDEGTPPVAYTKMSSATVTAMNAGVSQNAIRPPLTARVGQFSKSFWGERGRVPQRTKTGYFVRL